MAKLKPIKLKIKGKVNPEWTKQIAVVKAEIVKLNKIAPLLIE